MQSSMPNATFHCIASVLITECIFWVGEFIERCVGVKRLWLWTTFIALSWPKYRDVCILCYFVLCITYSGYYDVREISTTGWISSSVTVTSSRTRQQSGAWHRTPGPVRRDSCRGISGLWAVLWLRFIYGASLAYYGL